jgi:hypothetical protein
VTSSPAFESIAPLLVLVHGLAAIVTSGSIGHLGVLGAQRLRGKDVSPTRLGLHARLALLGFVVSFGLGLLAYPHYRYAVRGLVLDRDAPWASNLFDVKENVAAFTLPLLVVVSALEREAQTPRWSALFAVVAALAGVFVIVAGLLVTLVHGP